jgi:hypothetical protein
VPSRLAGDRERDFAPIPREKVAACLFSAPASFGVGLAAKVGNQRFRFEGDREPQITRPLVIGHLKNSWPPNPVTAVVKHKALRAAVTAITGRETDRAERVADIEPRPLPRILDAVVERDAAT